ncbi:MAG: GNAT family N-acetyltransferase [Acidobacteria bacterium]|nr:GNAT family N-acetyltransferase [Acidobacteriota bacterium]
MRNQLTTHPTNHQPIAQPVIEAAAALMRVSELTESNRAEAMKFLAVRPVHTVVMTSFINDNGLQSELNRGKFYGYRNAEGKLEGIALIGHSTLIEARSDAALRAFAYKARSSETPIHLIMSHGTAAETFWKYYGDGLTQPRLTCTERLFEVSFPFMVRKGSDKQVRPAKTEELLPIAKAQAEVAFMECGVDPMTKDREGFLKRVARRIEQGRVFVVTDGDKLVFKADIIAQTDDVIYLEGIYVAPEYRGKGLGSAYLSDLTLDLLNQAENVCLLSNVEFENAHKSFFKAGYKATDQCTTLFV